MFEVVTRIPKEREGGEREARRSERRREREGKGKERREGEKRGEIRSNWSNIEVKDLRDIRVDVDAILPLELCPHVPELDVTKKRKWSIKQHFDLFHVKQNKRKGKKEKSRT